MVRLLQACATIALIWGLTPVMLFAQFSISSNDILALKGTSRPVHATLDDSSETFVALEPGGTNLTWDYRNVNSTNFFMGTLEYQDAGDGYRAEAFPSANFRQRLSGELEQGSFILDFYLNVGSDQLTSLGNASNFSGFEMIEFEEDDVAPLPMTVGTSWLAVSSDTSTIGFITITVDSTWNTVDASGTLRLPVGDFECLRLREFSKTIQTQSFNGVPISSDTTESVFYTWLSKEHLQTFSVDSTENGMGEVSQMVAGNVSSVATASGNQPESFALEQNYPNPFNPETLIRFSLPASAHVELTITNLLGQTVRTLESGVLSQGEHTVTWDGRNAAGIIVPSGVYFYSLQVGKQVETRKMTFLR